MSIQHNDPHELLEVFDANGRPTGLAKPRAAIHLDGDWHLAFHCWIVRRQGAEVVLQRRSLLKDTFPGCWDASAAGHWRFGESAAQAAREIEEELGISIPFDRLRYRGRERAARGTANGLSDREFHEVYVLEEDRPLSEYRPDAAEVVGLAAFPSAELLALADGAVSAIEAVEALSVGADDRWRPTLVRATRDEFVPYPGTRLRRMLGRT